MDTERIEKALKKIKKALGIGTKTITLPQGVPGHNLTYVEREVSTDEPPAWPVNDELKVVGKRVKRIDAHAKVTGAAKFTVDIQLPGMLYGKMLRSPHPHARIRSVDTSAAEKYPGVSAVHVFKQVFGMAEPHGKDKSGEYPEILFAGQPIAGVAAQSRHIAEEALKLIKVDFEQLPFVVDLEEAQKPGAPVVFKTDVEQADSGGGSGEAAGLKMRGNIRGPSHGKPRGDVQKGFDQADIIVEGTYRTQVQNHCCLETHGVVVDWRPDGVTIYATTQNTKNVRNEFAEVFGLPKSKVRVICEFMGGGFGSKHKLGNFGVMAGYLSKKSGRPVSLMLERKEEFLATGNRPNSIQHLKIGAKKDGRLSAIEQRSHGTAGVALGAGVGKIVQSMYNCPNFFTEQYTVLTHAGPADAFRAPANVQGCFALEQLMDELAEKLGMDPLALRNTADRNEIRKIERKRGAETFDWSRRKKAGSDKGVVKKGLGMAQALWPKYVDFDSTAEIKAFSDGGIEIRSGVQDIGTGTKTILAQVVAEELGLQPEDITVHIGDTLFPDGPASGGSKVTGSITPAARNAAYKLKLQLFELVAEKLDTEASKLTAADGVIFSQANSAKKITFKDALKEMRTGQMTATASRSDDYSSSRRGDLGAVQFAEVSVDTETGFVKVEKILSVNSCGRPLNIGQIESQIEGGVIQGVSYALYENRVMDNYTGLQMNANMHQYKMPYSMEIPEIDIILIEEYDADTSTDALGIGEPPVIATAPAIANAVYNAIGVRIYDLPITPDKVLKALNKI